MLAVLHAGGICGGHGSQWIIRGTDLSAIEEHTASCCGDAGVVGSQKNQTLPICYETNSLSFRYAMFYTPADLGYKVAKFLPVKVVCSAMKEIYRCKKVYDGVTHAAKLYPNAYLIMIIVGTIKGNGAGFTRLMERLIRGVWTPTAMEFMQPSL